MPLMTTRAAKPKTIALAMSPLTLTQLFLWHILSSPLEKLMLFIKMTFKVKQSPFRAVEFRSFFSLAVLPVASNVLFYGYCFTTNFSFVFWNPVEFFAR